MLISNYLLYKLAMTLSLYFIFPVSGGLLLFSAVHFRKSHLILPIPISPNFT